MNKEGVKCLIVDDEPLATDLIQNYLERIDGFVISGVFHDAINAYNYLRTQEVDLIFLDINMPKLSGLDFIKSLSHKPKVIFTTAYREFAVEAFELDALDYIVKPLAFDRFLKAISRFNMSPSSIITTPSNEMEKRTHLYFKQGKEMIKVFLDEIFWIESIRDYVKINLGSKVIISYRRISELEKTLPHNLFLRVHRSYIISLSKISSFNNHNINIADHQIPIGKSYKQKVFDSILIE